MPFDPLSAGVAAGGMVLDFLKSQQARQDAAKNQEFQLQNLYKALGEAQAGRSQSLSAAGALRTDQFGNATYYDPAQGRWITSYSPGQERLIEGGVERQGRAQTRGAQASSDYDRLRGEYLYKKPKSEAESYAEIVDLINQARGTGERQLNTLMNRWGVRTAGNLPTLRQLDTGPTPGMELAETMLQARGAALDESLKRKAGHTSEYLPALKQFEDTANYVAPVDPTGSGILGMEAQGRQQQLSAMSDYDKLIATVYGHGGSDINNAASLTQKSYAGGPSSSDFLKFAQMLMPTPEKSTGTLGNTKGATYSGNVSGSDINDWDRRYNFGPKYNLSGRGTGGEGADIGITFGGSNTRGDPNYISPGADPYGNTNEIIKNRFGDWTFG